MFVCFMDIEYWESWDDRVETTTSRIDQSQGFGLECGIDSCLGTCILKLSIECHSVCSSMV
jgi:hypothetical protein